MRKLLMISAILYLIAVANVNAQDNKYRWDVKLLIDTAGLRIYKTGTQQETIDNLAVNSANPRPEKAEMKKPNRAVTEKRKVTVTCWITRWGLEEDGDYHLVLKSLDGDLTLIAEIPDPALAKLKGFPGLLSDYSTARSFIDSNIGKPGNVKEVSNPLKVKVTGVVFFDKIAHGTGHAQNGVEIHPVLKIRKAR